MKIYNQLSSVHYTVLHLKSLCEGTIIFLDYIFVLINMFKKLKEIKILQSEVLIKYVYFIHIVFYINLFYLYVYIIILHCKDLNCLKFHSLKQADTLILNVFLSYNKTLVK